ncbi:transcriptional regulator [Enterococcus casseliflavus]|uniref:helix-turn-helix domain-containing protein n=1 Tax=Enterococcus casseliflavus TaxID=37734 RepID=UPI000DFCF31E|nr:helix-turn-helix domain-containing protein [Enterococcus casseliflavus]GEB28748.1 hypothetical protein ECA02_18430 [Enterococcus casseliflavus]STP33506.1 transcriptional regulator [Enterococcus casseliflavus]
MRQLQLEFVMNSTINRWIQILNIIEKEQNFTLGDLSDILLVSQRTLVKDINEIKQYMGDSIDLQARQTGFVFKEVHYKCYMDKKSDLLESEILFYIIGQIFNGELRTIQELARDFNYGKNTVRRFLSRAEKALNSYLLNFSLNPVTLIGDEENIRKFFYDFYYLGEYTSHTIRVPKELESIVLDKLSDQFGNLEIGTGLSSSAMIFLLYVMIRRVQQNNFIKIAPKVKKMVEKEKDFQVLYSIQETISKEYDIKIPKEEFIWLYVVLITQRTMHNLDQEHLFLERFNQGVKVKAIATDYFSESKFSGVDQENMEVFLASFLVSKSFIQSVQPIWNKRQVEEIERVRKNYATLYQLNHQFLRKHRKDLKLTTAYFEDIVVEFTLFSNLLLNMYHPGKNVVFLLEGDSLLMQVIRQQAVNRLTPPHCLFFPQLVDWTSNQFNIEKIDLIVTNYRPYLWDYDYAQDYLLVNTIPNEFDWRRIMKYVNQRLESTYI